MNLRKRSRRALVEATAEDLFAVLLSRQLTSGEAMTATTMAYEKLDQICSDVPLALQVTTYRAWVKPTPEEDDDDDGGDESGGEDGLSH